MLSDPLLRREWDAHTHPGRCAPTQPAPPSRARRGADGRRRPRRTAPPPDAREARRRPAARRRPTRPAGLSSAAQLARLHLVGERGAVVGGGTPQREKRASPAQAPAASTGGDRQRRQRRRRRAGRRGAADTPRANFDVYNRSSGAAWSMAARAYFRRGDQELPRRGSFQYQGTQVLTAARARAAAEAEARQKAARAAASSSSRAPPERQPAAAAGHGLAYAHASAGVDARSGQRRPRPRAVPEATPRAALAEPRERLLYALVAWLPLAV